MIRLHRCVLGVLAGLLLSVPAAMAWGPLGHSVVAALAWQQLTPAARAQVQKLLDGSPWNRLTDLASWPDELRDYPRYQALWKATRHMHYINFHDRDCNYVPPRDCRDGECVVAAIEHYEAVLGNHSLPKAERVQALVFLVHFIGDIHQPLHAGYRHDAGGNRYQVRYRGHGTNLHRIWDSGLLDSRSFTRKQYVEFLDREGPVQLPAIPAGVKPPVAWAEESCRITRDIYPAGHDIDQAYVEKERPVAEKRLREAGARLAKVLNRLLG